MRWTFAVAVLLLVVTGAGAAATRPRADLSVTASSPRSARVGEPVRFEVTVLNRGPRAATRVTVTVRLPLDVDAFDASLGGRRTACDLPSGPGLARCRVAKLAPAEAWVLHFEGPATTPGRLRLTASVRTATRDPARRNNVARSSVTALPALGPTIGPPAAFAAAAGVEVQISLGSYCWAEGGIGICADTVLPPLASLPTLRVTQGEEVTFRLGFDPSELILSILRTGNDAVETHRLPHGRTSVWRVPDSFTAPPLGMRVWLFAAVPGRENASYFVRLVTS